MGSRYHQRFERPGECVERTTKVEHGKEEAQ